MRMRVRDKTRNSKRGDNISTEEVEYEEMKHDRAYDEVCKCSAGT